jgi:methylated-DNA-[protein]-cysteine S-methyltransferase
LWENENPNRVKLGEMLHDDQHVVLLNAEQQLTEYFAGRRQQCDLKLDLVGTEFQKKVWAALLTIPYGETRSYSHIASQIGNPKAVRAVGAANARNPLGIVVPCHRVISATGELTGFAGGIGTKKLLLGLEGRQSEITFSL